MNPWIEYWNPCLFVIGGIAGHNRQSVMLGRRGDDQIGLREGMADLAPFLDHKPPFEHDIFRDRHYPLLEHRAHSMSKPVVEFGTPSYIWQYLDTKADFRERDDADMKGFKRLLSHEGDNFRLRLRPPELRENIRVEQPRSHRETSRTGIVPRFDSISVSR